MRRGTGATAVCLPVHRLVLGNQRAEQPGGGGVVWCLSPGPSVKDPGWHVHWANRDSKDAAAKPAKETTECAKKPDNNFPSTRRFKMANRSKQLALLSLQALMMAACAEQSTPFPLDSQPVKRTVILALLLQARQLPAAPLCLPTCSNALTSERESWLNLLLTKPEPRA